MMNWDAIIRGSRLAKALGLTVFLAIFLLWWRFYGDPGPAVSEREVPGVIAEIYEKAYVVRLDSGHQIRVFRTVKVDKGTRVMVTATKYASGDESFVLMETGVLFQ